MAKSQAFIKKWWKNLIYDPRDLRPILNLDTKIVAIGGGSGLATLLRGLKNYSKNISAIITCTDEGASSGQLRREFDILPPGDIRKCISALSEDEDLMARIFEYRFPKKSKGFGGHTLGNIWLAGLTEHLGSFEKAIETSSEILKTAGKILPVSLSQVRLGAIYSDQTKSIGETNISKPDKKIAKIFLDRRVRAYPKAVTAFQDADVILIGPGSLYTSVLPNFLVGGIKKAIKSNKRAIKIYIANCSTERGETENLTVEDHINLITDYLGKDILDFCLANKKIIKKSKTVSRLGSVNNITATAKTVGSCKIIKADVINSRSPLYHDSKKLAKAIVTIYNHNEARHRHKYKDLGN